MMEYDLEQGAGLRLRVNVRCDPDQWRSAAGDEAALTDQALALLRDDPRWQPVGPVSRDFSAASGHVFSLFAEVLPPLRLPDSGKGLRVALPRPTFRPEVHAARLLDMRRRKARIAPCPEDTAVSADHIIRLDMVVFQQGRPVSGLSVDKVFYVMGAPFWLTGLDGLLTGLRAGGQAEGPVRCHTDYFAEPLADRELTARVTVREIYSCTLPEADDAFARACGMPSMEALHKELCKEVLNHEILQIRQEAERTLLESILDGQEVPLPQRLLDIYRNEYRNRLHAFHARYHVEGESFEDFLKGKAKEYETYAVSLARRQTCLMALGYHWGIQVDASEVEQRVEDIARKAGRSKEALRTELVRSGEIWDVQDRILAQKTLERLYSSAVKDIID